MTTIHATLANNGWWWDASSGAPSFAGAIVLALSVVALVLGAALVRRLAQMTRAVPERATARGLARDQRATATIEFVLVFPFLLFIALLLTQTTLLMGGNLFVHYAAFAATRSAIVHVPSTNPEEPANQIIDSSGHAKHDAIRRAAVMALLPVAGRLENTTNAAPLVQGIEAHFDAYGRPHPNWINNLVGQRYAYADANTQVKVYAIDIIRTNPAAPLLNFVDPPVTFGPRDPITVRVTHRFSLTVPYVSMFFADDTHSSDTGTGRYSLVESQYTLTNEGVIDALPPRPTLPRTP